MLFHLHLRKRLAQKHLEPYPARTPWLRFLDRIILLVGLGGPLATIPQIVKIYGSKSAADISPATFGAYAALDIVWIFYGLAHRERPIIWAYSSWLVVNTIVSAGALLYG
ncbi:hypothetical protein HYV30_01965 [Candidatus Kaiserbacteria bacterium]|nr:hypothetical protein [Candidatus Kaiserbacteria bacterium]